MSFKTKRYGEHAILLHGLGEEARSALRHALESGLPIGCTETVEGYDSLLFVFEEADKLGALPDWLDNVADGSRNEPRGSGMIHEVPVTYDGPDLQQVARQTGLSIAEVVELHSKPIYTVRMMGFSPGFPYLDGLDPRLQLPRRDSPRNHIKPGAVAIGGPHAGIYSVASPGGWHLLGWTDRVLFNPDAAKAESIDPRQVFPLKPGDRLRFNPIAR